MTDTTDPMEAAAQKAFGNSGPAMVLAAKDVCRALADNLPPEMVEAACQWKYGARWSRWPDHTKRFYWRKMYDVLRAALLALAGEGEKATIADPRTVWHKVGEKK